MASEIKTIEYLRPLKINSPLFPNFPVKKSGFLKKCLQKVRYSVIISIMKRKIYKQLLEWKISEFRLPLILQGARQVGKTYILKQFGKTEYPVFHIFNFEQDEKLIRIFDEDLNASRIIKDLSLYSGKKIDIKNDLVFFDEIQMCPKALTSLKYFCEDLPQLHLCCAGSLLGTALADESFPVGKVEFLPMFPMTFTEFLEAVNDEMSLDVLKDLQHSENQSQTSHDRIWERLKTYYLTGGMPKVVKSFGDLCDENMAAAIMTARAVQKNLIDAYYKDFAKHSGKVNAMHIASVLENVPIQLSKNINDSVKRYRFKGVVPGKKAFTDLQGPINWLEKAGLIIKVKICNRAEIPLESFCKYNLFKLYMFDIGILGAMLEIPETSLLLQNYGIIRGYFAENFVAQELRASGSAKLHSWQSRNSEIEFLKQQNSRIVPIEVKSGVRTQAKSLAQYIKTYTPEIAIKLSGKPLNLKGGSVLKNLPLYMAGML